MKRQSRFIDSINETTCVHGFKVLRMDYSIETNTHHLQIHDLKENIIFHEVLTDLHEETSDYTIELVKMRKQTHRIIDGSEIKNISSTLTLEHKP